MVIFSFTFSERTTIACLPFYCWPGTPKLLAQKVGVRMNQVGERGRDFTLENPSMSRIKSPDGGPHVGQSVKYNFE